MVDVLVVVVGGDFSMKFVFVGLDVYVCKGLVVFLDNYGFLLLKEGLDEIR